MRQAGRWTGSAAGIARVERDAGIGIALVDEAQAVTVDQDAMRRRQLVERKGVALAPRRSSPSPDRCWPHPSAPAPRRRPSAMRWPSPVLVRGLPIRPTGTREVARQHRGVPFEAAGRQHDAAPRPDGDVAIAALRRDAEDAAGPSSVISRCAAVSARMSQPWSRQPFTRPTTSALPMPTCPVSMRHSEARRHRGGEAQRLAQDDAGVDVAKRQAARHRRAADAVRATDRRGRGEAGSGDSMRPRALPPGASG